MQKHVRERPLAILAITAIGKPVVIEITTIFRLFLATSDRERSYKNQAKLTKWVKKKDILYLASFPLPPHVFVNGSLFCFGLKT